MAEKKIVRIVPECLDSCETCDGCPSPSEFCTESETELGNVRRICDYWHQTQTA